MIIWVSQAASTGTFVLVKQDVRSNVKWGGCKCYGTQSAASDDRDRRRIRSNLHPIGKSIWDSSDRRVGDVFLHSAHKDHIDADLATSNFPGLDIISRQPPLDSVTFPSICLLGRDLTPEKSRDETFPPL
nr:hypothetical protein CFP56_48782 [Quercus suber]